ncbi:hypothetical protein FALB51S_03956 [Frigidibacter albus]
MTLAKLRHGGQEAALQYPRGGAGGQDFRQRGMIDAFDAGEFRPGADQHRTAPQHVIADIVEIARRQDPALAVAVEDDEVELVDLLDEQFLRREGDQRQLGDRHAVLLFGRAQDGEMHEVDRGVGFQQVAPGALAGMGLARDQQHPQPVAHAIDLHHGSVVAVGQLALGGGEVELHHVLPAMLQRQRQFQIGFHRHLIGFGRAAVDGQRHIDRAPGLGSGHRAHLLDAHHHRQGLADDAEGRRGLHHQPPVPVDGAPGLQQCQRRGHVGGEGKVMRLPVGNQDRAGHPGARFFGQRRGQRCHQQGAGILGAVAQVDAAQFGVGQRRDLGLDPRHGGGGLFRAPGQGLAGAAIHHHQHDVGQRLAVFRLQRRAGKRGQERHRGKPAQPPAGQPAPQRQRHHQPGQHRGCPDQRRGQKRVKYDPLHHYCPSLSSSAGT